MYRTDMFDLNQFIAEHVTKRKLSMFIPDLEANDINLEKHIANKTFLVIGGAGSIGASFIRSVLPLHPAALVVVDINENALAELTRDLRSAQETEVPDEYITYPMDYASPVFRKMFRAHGGFDFVCNFSAHKHVRSEKDIYSIEALLQNNILHAKGLLDLLTEYPPETYFCVSTDKAANPTNVMGASKRIMEDLIFSYSYVFPVKTARFANVAFSNGSLLAGFLSRVQKLQPLSAPTDIRRYFVSPEESGQICMMACICGGNREILFPKLEKEQMVSFDEIATSLLHEFGYEVLPCSSEREAIEKSGELRQGGKRYPVFFSKSDTSGEKPYEEFFTDQESIDYNRFSSLGVIVDKKMPNEERINKLLTRLSDEFEQNSVSKERILQMLKDYLPNFTHIETGKSLDSKM